MSGKTARKAGAVFCLFLLCLAVAGCWDMREIHERNFVLAVAIDTADEGMLAGKDEKAAKLESYTHPEEDNRYRVSLQILRLVEAGQESESESKSKTFVISSTGQSIFHMIRNMLGQTGKSLYFEHIQAVIISEAAAKQAGLRPISDWFARDAEARWRISLFITPGEASPFLEFVPPAGDPGGIYYAQLTRNWKKNPYIVGAVSDVGFMILAMDKQQPVLLPRLEMTGKMAKTGGFALFKNDKFVKYVDEYNTQGSKFVKGIEKVGVITIPCLENPQEVITFEYFRHDTLLTPHVDGDNIYFTLSIALYGNISESGCTSIELFEPEYLRRLEVAIAEEVKRNALSAHTESQLLKIDMNGLGNELAARNPRLWRKIKSKWQDELLPQVPLYTSVNVTIRGVGEHK